MGRILDHEDTVLDVAFGVDDTVVATAGADGRAKVWQLAARQFHRMSYRCQDEVWIVSFSRTGGSALAVGDGRARRGGYISVLGGDSGKDLVPRTLHYGPGRSAALSPDGQTLLIGRIDDAGRTARLVRLDKDGAKSVNAPLAHDGLVNVVAFRGDGRIAATADEAGCVCFWDVTNGLPVGHRLRTYTPINAIAFSQDGGFLVAGGHDGSGYIWDYTNGRQHMGSPLKHPGAIWTVSVSPDSRTVLTGGRDKSARLWNARTGEPQGQGALAYAGFGWTAFNPKGSAVLTGSDLGAQFWDVATARPVGPVLPHRAPVWATAVSPDGRVAATGSLDGTIRFWDVTTSLPLGPALSHESSVWSVAFSPSGKLLLSGSNDRTVKTWDVPAAL